MFVYHHTIIMIIYPQPISKGGAGVRGTKPLEKIIYQQPYVEDD